MAGATGPRQLGKLVANRRSVLRRTARQVARDAGIDVATLTRLERGFYTAPAPATLRGLSDALDIPILELFQVVGYVTPYDVVKLIAHLANQAGSPADVRHLRSDLLARLIQEYRIDAGRVSNTDQRERR